MRESCRSKFFGVITKAYQPSSRPSDGPSTGNGGQLATESGTTLEAAPA